MGTIGRPTLPTETVIDIFDILFATGGGLVEAVRLSGVDKVMRDIVTSRPTYWSTIVLDMHFSSILLAQVCIERSQKEPITLHVIVKGENHLWGQPSPAHTEDIIRLIVTSAPRLKVLTISMETMNQQIVFRTALPRLYQPKLTSLTLDYQCWSHWGSGNREFSPARAPRLRSLTLNGVTPDLLKAEPYAKLTSLRLGVARSFIWPTGTLAGILRHAVKLEELYLEGREDELIQAFDRRWITVLGAYIPCPKLRSLSIIHADEYLAEEIIKNINAPVLETVKLLRPAKGDFHKPEFSPYGGISTSPIESVRNLITYHNAKAVTTDITKDSFYMFINATFIGITSLEIGTAATRVFGVWAWYKSAPSIKYWHALEKLKVHRTPKEESEEGTARQAVKETLAFVRLRKTIPGCRWIEELLLDTTDVGEDPEVTEMLDALRRDVENVTFGKVEMTPWKE